MDREIKRLAHRVGPMLQDFFRSILATEGSITAKAGGSETPDAAFDG